MAAKIEAKVVYSYAGVDYPTKAKAMDSWENDVNRFVRERLCNGDMGIKAQTFITEALLAHRRELVGLLALVEVGLDEEEEDN